MSKKFVLTKEKKVFCGRTLFRIKALVDLKWCKKGDLGGFVEKEANLSQDGNAWVSDNAWVYGSAWVYGDAEVSGSAWVSGSARVSGWKCVQHGWMR